MKLHFRSKTVPELEFSLFGSVAEFTESYKKPDLLHKEDSEKSEHVGVVIIHVIEQKVSN